MPTLLQDTRWIENLHATGKAVQFQINDTNVLMKVTTLPWDDQNDTFIAMQYRTYNLACYTSQSYVCEWSESDVTEGSVGDSLHPATDYEFRLYQFSVQSSFITGTLDGTRQKRDTKRSIARYTVPFGLSTPKIRKHCH